MGLDVITYGGSTEKQPWNSASYKGQEKPAPETRKEDKEGLSRTIEAIF